MNGRGEWSIKVKENDCNTELKLQRKSDMKQGKWRERKKYRKKGKIILEKREKKKSGSLYLPLLQYR